MIKLIVGNKGSGKTKALVRMANEAVVTTSGNVVCVEKDLKLTYDLNHQVRLIDTDNYKIGNYDQLYGFLTGVLAGNYDITEMFIDGTMRIGGKDLTAFTDLVQKLAEVIKDDNTTMIFTVSCDQNELQTASNNTLSNINEKMYR